MEGSIIKFILDIGNSKIKLLAGELKNFGNSLEVLSYVEVPSKGIRKNVIENQVYLSESIAEAVKQMEQELNTEIKEVVLGIAGTNIYSRTKNVKIFFEEEKFVTEEDMQRLLDVAESELKQSKETVLESEIYNTRVNNSGIIKNPVGLTGREICADVHLIFVNEVEIDEITEVVNRTKLQVESIVLNPYASAKSTLTDEDKNMGAALIDIGEGKTDIVIYKNNKLIYAKSLPLGGMHYVSDLEYLFKIPKQDAKNIVEKINEIRDRKDYQFPVGTNKFIKVETIREVVDARTGDLVTFIKKAIEESGFTGYLGKGIYITGGASRLDELFEGVKSNMGYTVKRVSPIKLKGLKESKPEQATVVGILLEVMQKEYNNFESERIKREEEAKILEKPKIVNIEPENQEETNIDELNKEKSNKNKENDNEEKEGFGKKIKTLFSKFI